MSDESVFIDQRVADLRHHLVFGTLNTEALNVLCKKHMTLQGLNFELGIIGASHYVSVSKGDRTFSEVVACIDLNENPPETLCHSIELKDACRDENEKHSMALEEILPVSYAMDPPIIAKISEARNIINRYTEDVKVNNENHQGLLYEFPKGDLESSPRTIVIGRKVSNALFIRTMHEYPNEGNVAFTKSIFTITNKINSN